MSRIIFRPMRDEDRWPTAHVMSISGNYWNEAHGMGRAFPAGPQAAVFQFDVYRKLDVENLGYAAVDEGTGAVVGICFMHLRPTHVSLGTLNVHPNWFGQGVATGLVRRIIDFATDENKPLRLVSSASNMDSYALYNRAGFVPIRTYQQMFLDVPPGGLKISHSLASSVRDAEPGDVEGMVELEMKLSGIDRRRDWEYLIRNEDRVWHMSVFQTPGGPIEGFLCSIDHPLGGWMLGPGVARTDDQAAALALAELNRTPGRRVVFLFPNDRASLAAQAYGWGARVTEIQMHQVLGEAKPLEGINFPAFVPETG